MEKVLYTATSEGVSVRCSSLEESTVRWVSSSAGRVFTVYRKHTGIDTPRSHFFVIVVTIVSCLHCRWISIEYGMLLQRQELVF